MDELQRNQPPLLQRMAEVEQGTKSAHERLHVLNEKNLADLRYLADQLGVVLPSDQPQPMKSASAAAIGARFGG